MLFMAPNGTATVQVEDADVSNVTENIPATVTDDYPAQGTTRFFELDDSNGLSGALWGTGTPGGDEISGTPVIESIDDGALDAHIPNFVVNVANAGTGVISVQYTGSSVAITGAGDIDIALTYDVAALATVSIDLESESGAITMVLDETEAGSGIFQGTFVATTTDDANVDPALITAPAGEVIRATYEDVDDEGDVTGTRSNTITVEENEPLGVLVSPDSGSRTNADEPAFVVDWTDLEAGVDEDTIEFVCIEATGITAIDCDDVEAAVDSDFATITNGLRATFTLIGLDDDFEDDTLRLIWTSTASDNAGNAASTDADASEADVQPFVNVVDQEAPALDNATATTGVWFDEAEGEVVDDPLDADNTMIGIMFPDVFPLDAAPFSGTGAYPVGDHDFDSTFEADAEVEMLDVSSLSAADFEIEDLKTVGGSTVSGIDPTAVHWFEDAPNWIFLEVPAMASDAEPIVHVMSTFNDSEGNAVTVGDIGGDDELATDGIAPGITWELNRVIDDANVTINIQSDEPLAANPVVNVNDGLTGDLQKVATLVGTREWETTLIPAADGVYAIEIDVTDGPNAVTIGNPLDTEDFPTDDSIVFYIDGNLDEADVSSGEDDLTPGDVEVEEAVPFFIEIGFLAEGTEYGLTAGDMDNDGDPDTDLDVNNEVTITDITIDGEDVASFLDTQNNRAYTLVLDEIAIGDHTLMYTAEDEAGNEVEDVEIDFTVIERQPYEIAMRVGWNLISFPGTPQDSDIDSVLPSTHPATDVLTFDDGVWSVATRLSGGEWEGTLTEIDGQHGYWINTTASTPVEALLALPTVGNASTLPSIPIEQGWNLVAVTDVALNDGDDDKDAVDYFVSLDWAIAYTYNATSRTWTRLTADAGEVNNGQGVWVWANEDGTLVP
jgi:hypothetical protein